MLLIWGSLVCLSLVSAQTYDEERDWRCPQHWVQFRNSCYRFIKSPLRSRNDARKNCQAYGADLVSISSSEEHGFLIYQLLWQDPQHRRWYIGARQTVSGYWENDGDGTSLNDLDAAFLHDPEFSNIGDYLVYSFSNQLKHWGFEKVSGNEELLYICEVSVHQLHYVTEDDRSYSYGVEIDDPDRVPHGPYFIKEPVNVVYDVSSKKATNDVTLSCLAGGYPNPTYEWFKEDHQSRGQFDQVISHKIDPLNDPRFTISGGNLIISNPHQVDDRGSYHCKASNKFGSIISESANLIFDVIGEFNLKRSPEIGKENWGKAVFCDPPQTSPDVRFYWARDNFPNLVEEDRRVFVSYDGALYFSALEIIDQGNYSCNVQSTTSDSGRNGPFFPIQVQPHSNSQQLKFPNNFPKVFPGAPVAGMDIRLECVAFGYPVPSYEWSRRGASLPKHAVTENYNRVLFIPKARVEDQGDYVCKASNSLDSIKHFVTLTIQAQPNFTIPLSDKHMDKEAELTWVCEAFGIPDVTYSWLKNGEPLDVERLPPEDIDRYSIQDNVLKIKYLNPSRDPGMFQCKASNIFKTSYSSAQLRVLSMRPSFKKHPLEPETYAGEGGSVTLLCNPEAAPRPTFKWLKDNLTIGSGGRRRILDNGNLIISPVSREDGGMYTCRADNSYGYDESQGHVIVLKGPKLIEELPPKISTTIGKDIYLHCKAISEEVLDLAYIWNHNGIRIKVTDYPVSKLKMDGGYLVLRNLSLADAGDYECIIKSSVGVISSKTSIKVDGPPGPPGGIQVSQISRRSATLQWTDGATNGREVTHYIVSGRTQYNYTWVVLAEDTKGSIYDRYNGRKMAVLENILSPYSTYEFQVQAVNSLGPGIPSAPSPKYSTLSDKPYKAPENVGGGGGKTGDLVITWDPLPPQEQNGPGLHYRVYWRRHSLSNNPNDFEVLILRKNIGVAVVGVPLEDYYTKYDVKVEAVNDEGVGPISNVTTIYSAEDMPQVAPQQVAALAHNSTALNVSWTPIEQTREKIRGKLIGHRIKYWRNGNAEEDSVYYLSRNVRPWALIVGLQPDTYYNVKVMAYNSAGEGPESERYLEKTYRKAPQKPPTSVNVDCVDPNTVKVVWRYVQPSSEEEPVLGFKVRVWEVDQDMSTANDTIIPVGSHLKAFVNHLSPGKMYYLRVLAYSNGGDGRMSSPAINFLMGDKASLLSDGSHLLNSPFLLLSCVFMILQYHT